MGMKAHGVVQAGFDMSGAVGCSAVKVADADRDGLRAALEVGTDRSDDHAELIFLCRLHADHDAGSKHIRTDIQRSAAAVRRYPCSVGLDDLVHCLEEALCRERRHFHAGCGIHHSLRVHVRAESHDAAVFPGVSLQALEDLLAVMKNACALADLNSRIIDQAALIPLAVFPVGDIALISRHVSEPKVSPVNVLLLHIKYPFS